MRDAPAVAPDVAARPSFQRRLLWTLGTVLAVALGTLGVLLWLGVYAWLTVGAYDVLDAELTSIGQVVVTPDGVLDPARYAWDEPHHRFVGPHIDPYFVQVFDPEGRVVRQSDNVTFLASGRYPDRLLPADDGPGLLPRLRLLQAGEHTLYYLTRPLRAPDGTTVGYLQVAREEPGIGTLMRRLALVLGVGLLLTLATLLVLLRWRARRVAEPLATITDAARAISARDLGRRIPVPDAADAEAAQLATTLNAQLGRLEQAFEEMYRFTANAAHELQTPLTVLRGHVDVALRRDRDPVAYRATLAVVRDEVDALSRMVRSLLTLARLDREARVLGRTPVDLAAVVRDEAARALPAAEARGLHLHVDAPATAHVAGQADLLREVVANVLDNALKYTPEGHVRVAVEHGDGAATLRVTDTGIGMDEEARRHAADRFYRAAGAERLDVAGSGLGLALVAQIVARHGGRLHLDAAPDGGTQVTITLPGFASAG